jgi:lipopolysaccharide cholinephosphotransferase
MWMTIKSKRNVLPLKYFTRFTDIEFNGQIFKAPEDYDEFLSDYYGDYRSLPPVEQQKPHHEYKAYYV